MCDPYVDNLVEMKINSINEIILKSHLLVKLVNHDQFELIDFGENLYWTLVEIYRIVRLIKTLQDVGFSRLIKRIRYEIRKN